MLARIERQRQVRRAVEIADGHKPVSYTHLDVYKRQCVDRGAAGHFGRRHARRASKHRVSLSPLGDANARGLRHHGRVGDSLGGVDVFSGARLQLSLIHI